MVHEGAPKRLSRKAVYFPYRIGHERTVIPVGSGFIAGETLMGAAIAALVVAGLLGE